MGNHVTRCEQPCNPCVVCILDHCPNADAGGPSIVTVDPSRPVLANSAPAAKDEVYDAFYGSMLEMELANEVEFWRMETNGSCLWKAAGRAGNSEGLLPSVPIFGTALSGGKGSSGHAPEGHFLEGLGGCTTEVPSSSASAWDVEMEDVDSSRPSSFVVQGTPPTCRGATGSARGGWDARP